MSHPAFAPHVTRRLRLRAAALVCLLPLACAVATEPELDGDDSPLVTSGSGGSSTNNPSPAGTTGGSKNIASGGSAASGSPSASGGTSSTGKGGTSTQSGGSSSSAGSSAGKSNGVTGGSGGKTSTGGSSSGSGGSAIAGSGGTGSGGGAATSCGNATAWKGGDPTLTISEGETVSWKGKRYVATTNIAYPNAECAPDAPAAWCAEWFMADGDC
jgi:hypothetical protein